MTKEEAYYDLFDDLFMAQESWLLGAFDAARRCFESQDKALEWLFDEYPTFYRRTPREVVIESKEGSQKVMSYLDRLEHGFF
jgi:uncharacterized protein (DUF2384 family)